MNRVFRNFSAFFAAPSRDKREIELDVVRGVAILLALGWHFNDVTGSAVADFFLYPGHAFGWAGVDLFFVLSGFLIGRLVFQEIKSSGKFDYKRFLIRRVLRLWPTLYLFLIAQLFFKSHDWHDYFFQTAFHVQNFFDSGIAHLWSLAVEEHFYLIFGLLCLAFAPRLRSRSATPFILIFVLILSPLLRYAAAQAGWDQDTIQRQTEFRCDALAAGILMAYGTIFHPALFDRLLRARLAWLVLTLTGCVWLIDVPRGEPWQEAATYIVSWITSASFILLLYRNKIVELLPGPAGVLAFLGIYSYSLYIWQFSGVRIADAVQKHVAFLNNPVCAMLLKYIGSIAVAYLISRLIEKPVMKLRDRIYGVHPSKIQPAA